MSEKNSSKMKKRLITVIIVLLAVLLLMYLCTEIMQRITDPKNKPTEETADYNFYPADYSEDIYADEEYVALTEGGIITYNENANTSYTLDVNNLNSYDRSVQMLVEMIYSVIDGDVEEYNSFFSGRYLEDNAPKDKFTKQKIYSVEITFMGNDTVTENENTYQKYEYEISYRIYKNNGTFRNDIGDGARKQLITLTDREGRLLIDSIVAYQYK